MAMAEPPWRLPQKALLAAAAGIAGLPVLALYFWHGNGGHMELSGSSDAVELWGQPSKPQGAACAAHPGCAGLAGDCCPTWDGLNLGCCFSWPSPGQQANHGDGQGRQQFPEPTHQPQNSWAPQTPPPPTPYILPPDSQPQAQDAHSLMPDLFTPEEAESALRYGTLRDPFSELLRPETMQPIYLLPVSNGFKQLFTFFVFGFDLKFQPKKGTAKSKVVKFIISSFVKMAMIGLAINSIIHDVQRFQRREDINETNYNDLLTLMAVWCTSPNFAAGLGLWGQLRIQSPGAVFRDDIETARYRHLCIPSQSSYYDVRFPIFPGRARWLSVMKQLYALVLLPYVVPAMVLEVLMSILFCYWIIFQSRLSCLFKCLQVHVFMFGCMFVWLLTFGHFGANGIGKYWTSLWPFVYMYMVYIFASFIVPVAMAFTYGILSGSAFHQICKGIGCWETSQRRQPGKVHKAVGWLLRLCNRDSTTFCGQCFASLEKGFTFLMPHRELQLEKGDRDLLLRLDEHRLTQDFQFRPDTETSEHIARLRSQLAKLRARWNGDSDSDGATDDEYAESPRKCFDVMVGDETCVDGDINVERDPRLKHDIESGQEEYNLEDAEVQVVMLTIKAMAEVAIVQAVTIFLVRAFLGNSFSDFVNAMHITIQERHIKDYINHVMSLGEEKLGSAFNTVWSIL
ncbi:unnamed protein product [Durusdinium trenchii]|uniref:Uncharacterized protein n=1 Tax=Durusdinium trenchii TaxID=1381693 RepID=A0ABP0MSW2_9DINO